MTDLMMLLGAALICIGAFLWSLPAGIASVGLAVIAAAIVLERAGIIVRATTIEGDDT